MEDSLRGLSLKEALKILRAKGINPELCYTKSVGKQRDQLGLTPRVLRFQNNQLLISYFQDNLEDNIV